MRAYVEKKPAFTLLFLSFVSILRRWYPRRLQCTRRSPFHGLVDQVRRNVEFLHSPRKKSAIFPLDQNNHSALHTDVSANPK
jgi:hypothetical protein